MDRNSLRLVAVFIFILVCWRDLRGPVAVFRPRAEQGKRDSNSRSHLEETPSSKTTRLDFPALVSGERDRGAKSDLDLVDGGFAGELERRVDRFAARLRYCRPGVFPANPARRNASAIASPLAGTGLLRPARVSADRRRFSDSLGGISARAVDGRASRA